MNKNKPNKSSIYHLGDNDIDKASSVYARAFFDYPTINWALPDLKKREEVSKDMFAFVFKTSFINSDIVSTSNDMKGIAIWQDSLSKNISLWQQIRCGGLSLIWKVGYTPIKKFMFLDSYWKKLEKKHIDSHHILLYHIGVDPKWQGQGIASQLVRHKINEIQKENIPLCVLTNTKENVLIYTHLGFEVTEKTTIPNTTIPQWCLILNP